MEPLLNPKYNRLVMFPIQYPDIWRFYQDSVKVFWTPEEIKLSGDLKDWETLNENEVFFISNILAFFAASDGLVNENIGERFLQEVELTEAKAFYTQQLSMETIHSVTYSLLIDTYIKDPKEKYKLFNGIETIPCIEKKSQWVKKWISSNDSFATRLVAFACVEGIFFSGSFCAIFWLKKRGLMPGLCFSNELISRDEGMHCDFACLLYSQYIKNKVNSDTIYELIGDAVKIEKEFITESLPCRLIGMNAELMSQYIEFVADRLCLQLGYNKIYNSENPFDWMVQQGAELKANFFENRVGNYAKTGVGVSESDMNFSLDGEF
tara:strand:+ start:220 stop:1185 length:966 start_codon:yes stop_codon:yes gene_type:complete